MSFRVLWGNIFNRNRILMGGWERKADEEKGTIWEHCPRQKQSRAHSGSCVCGGEKAGKANEVRWQSAFMTQTFCCMERGTIRSLWLVSFLNGNCHDNVWETQGCSRYGNEPLRSAAGSVFPDHPSCCPCGSTIVFGSAQPMAGGTHTDHACGTRDSSDFGLRTPHPPGHNFIRTAVWPLLGNGPLSSGQICTAEWRFAKHPASSP